ncbi:MAG: alpha/beta fold hydrolase [Solirubrobacteraceae bacterium]
MTDPVPRLLFIPGLGGEGSFWEPVAERLPAAWRKRYLDWPGLGPNPPSPGVRSLDDLVELVVEALEDSPMTLIAQSMGCLVALRTALRAPRNLLGLVLTVAPAAVNMPDPLPGLPADLELPGWVLVRAPEVSAERLCAVAVPTLLISATRDPHSPLAVAEELARTLPIATVFAIDSDDHAIARSHAATVAEAIERHLNGAPFGSVAPSDK